MGDSRLSEAEKRILRHGVTPGCPLCEEAAEALKNSFEVPKCTHQEETGKVKDKFDEIKLDLTYGGHQSPAAAIAFIALVVVITFILRGMIL